jgi:hypothetical protein
VTYVAQLACFAGGEHGGFLGSLPQEQANEAESGFGG